MSRQDKTRSTQQRSRVAAVAARMLAEEGVSDLGLAKRKAARALGLVDGALLPEDDEVDAELRTHLRLFHEDEQPARSALLLRAAVRLMAIVERFNPYLSGPVLEGTAGRYAEIDIQLFVDSVKDVEIFLLNERIPFRHSTPRSDRADAVLTVESDDAIANLVVYPRAAERISFGVRAGKARRRARLEAVRRLLAEITDGQ